MACKGCRERRERMLRLGRLLYRRGLAQQKRAADASEQTEQQPVLPTTVRFTNTD
jgi:hypothetical protein